MEYKYKHNYPFRYEISMNFLLLICLYLVCGTNPSNLLRMLCDTIELVIENSNTPLRNETHLVKRYVRVCVRAC